MIDAPAAGLPALLAHRGGALEAPENTLASIAHAVACGADGIEIDVRLTADRVPVVFHDPDLARLAGDPRRISELTWRELRAVRISPPVTAPTCHAIPTLARALAAARPLARVNLELKPDAIGAGELAAAIVDEVERSGAAARVVYSSFDPAIVEALGRLRPRSERGRVIEVEPADDGWAAHGWVALERALARSGWAREAGARGLRVLVWTENDEETLAHWRSSGVDGVITDRPARFAAARERLDRDEAQPVAAAGDSTRRR